MAIRLRQLHRHAECTATRDDRHLVQRIGVGKHRGNDGVTGFVIRTRDALVLAHDHRLAFNAHQNLVARRIEIGVSDRGAPAACGAERCLVDEIGEIGTGETWRPARDRSQVDVWLDRDRPSVNAKDLLASLQIRITDGDLPIEPARPQQCGIEDVRAVGGSNNNDAVRAGEAVHLDKQLIECLLALFVAERVAAAMAADGVELVDEDDARRMTASLAEQPANAGRANAGVHLDELRAAG